MNATGEVSELRRQALGRVLEENAQLKERIAALEGATVYVVTYWLYHDCEVKKVFLDRALAEAYVTEGNKPIASLQKRWAYNGRILVLEEHEIATALPREGEDKGWPITSEI